ncbi:MAG: hypothetical protein ACOC1S_01890 [bacterium]
MTTNNPENNYNRELYKDCSFLIRIKFRQNATYQGEIHWINNDSKKVFFRSLLELVSLLEEAMDSLEQPKANYQIRKWPKKEKKDSPYYNQEES